MGSAPDRVIEELRRFRRRVSKRYKVQRMILFGSRARGKTHEFSDVDLILVSPWFRRRGAISRAYPMHLEWDLGYPVDFLCYTPEEFRRLSARAGPVREALREGIEISEA